MSDDKKPVKAPVPKVPRYSYRKRGSGRAVVSVRTAFHSMGFDAAVEWVKAFRELENPMDKIKALEKSFEYLFPKVSPVTTEAIEKLIEMDEEDEETVKIEDVSTDKLLETLEIKK